MYLEFYGLKEKPFNATPDPKFLYLTPGHREALAQLTYGVQEHKGFLVLTGECQRTLGKSVRLLHAANQHLRLSQGETTEHLKASHFHCNRLFYRLRQQRHGVGNAPT